MGFTFRLTLPNTSAAPALLPFPTPSSSSSSPPTVFATRRARSRRPIALALIALIITLVLTISLGVHTGAAVSEHAGRLVEAGKAQLGKHLYKLEGVSTWDEEEEDGLDYGYGVGYGYGNGEVSEPVSRVDGWRGDTDILEEDGALSSDQLEASGGSEGQGWWRWKGLLPTTTGSKKTSDRLRCWGWDPEQPEEMDPPGCLRARQYRQVVRVLEREERGEHAHWYFTRQWNLDTFRNISRCFLPLTHENYTACPDRPLIVSGWWYSAEVITGSTTGEVIWQTSLFKQIQHFNLSVACVGPYENWVEVAEMMPDVYRFIWVPDVETVSCVTDPRCIAKAHYVPPVGASDLSVGVPDDERGVIPIWMIQVPDYWGARPKEIANTDYYWGLTEEGDWSFHPLGQAWIATPWPLPGHVHLPYSIEEYCLPLKVKPHEEREDKVLVFAKRSSYFHYTWHSPLDFGTRLAADPSFELLSTVNEEEGKPIPEGLTTMGGKSRGEYEALVGSVKVLLGIGSPMISPSVYDALCQGTPVVLPIFTEEYRTDGWYRFAGWSQHGPAILLGEPYVYSYFAQNYTSLETAVHKALSTSIPRFVPEDMTLPYCLPKMEAFLKRDLDVLRNNSGRIPALIRGARERCYELNRCRPELEVGRRPNTPERRRRERQMQMQGTVEDLEDDSKVAVVDAAR